MAEEQLLCPMPCAPVPAQRRRPCCVWTTQERLYPTQLDGAPTPPASLGVAQLCAVLAALRERWAVPLVACTFKRPLVTASAAARAAAADAVPSTGGVAANSLNTGGNRRFSAVAHAGPPAEQPAGQPAGRLPGGAAAAVCVCTEGTSVEHHPVQALGGGDAWVAGFLSRLTEVKGGGAAASPTALRAACRTGDLLAALAQQRSVVKRGALAAAQRATCGSRRHRACARRARWAPEQSIGRLGPPSTTLKPFLAAARDASSSVSRQTHGDLSAVTSAALQPYLLERLQPHTLESVTRFTQPAALGAQDPQNHAPGLQSYAPQVTAAELADAEREWAGRTAVLPPPRAASSGSGGVAGGGGGGGAGRQRSQAEVVAAMGAARLVPVVVVPEAAAAAELGRALLAGGATIVEIVLRTAAAEEVDRWMDGWTDGWMVG